jgi:cellulose synthase/poly-beta-1,6-N-acetylglucosamine synthase-like glycosyltransferase
VSTQPQIEVPPRQPIRDTAAVVLSRGQVIFMGLEVAALGVQAYWWGWRSALIGIILACLVFYLVTVSFKTILNVASYLSVPTKLRRTPDVDDPDLPYYTVLLPVHKEKGPVLRSLIAWMSTRLLYPANKVQFIVLVEHDDFVTQQRLGVIEADEGVERLVLPRNFDVLVTEPGGPQTKPCAMAYGLREAIGEYCTVYDAEDRPSPMQLLQAVRDFRAAGPEVACVQARLVFWNAELHSHSWMQAFVTTMYYLEYVVHFEYILKGMAMLGLTPPLGGTSNHFRVVALRAIAIPEAELIRRGIPRTAARRMTAAWDPWNVAEDADIAGWLARHGFKVQMLQGAYTLEESIVSLSRAARQRARWGKGYAQSGIVQTRHPIRAIREMGFWQFCAYILLMVGTPFTFLINPIFWALTIVYFTTHSLFIESLFPPLLFYVGGGTALVGNFLLVVQLFMAALHDREENLVKYIFFVPLWWLGTSYAMWKGVLELVVPAMRFHWHVTEHGNEDPIEAEGAMGRHHAKLQSGIGS